MLNKSNILAERLRRQRLTEPLESRMGYEALVEALQPIAPIANTRPGDPPRLVHRVRFDDGAVADRLRARQTLVKGRFGGGTIGYVLAKDLALYANTYRRPLERASETQRIVLDAVQTLGPLTPRQQAEETGLLNKQVMPALHRLQEAFLVYEEQVDNDWERAWYDFSTAWPDARLSDAAWPDAAREVLRRLLHSLVFATEEQLRDSSQFPKRPLAERLAQMEAEGELVAAEVEGLGRGWRLAEDAALPDGAPPRQTWMLHRADPLVRAHASELKRRFAGHEVLQWLLIDGEFGGAVVGHWRIGPHDVDDIVLELPDDERAARRDEVVAAVATVYHPPHHEILRYDGRPIGRG